MALFDSHLNFAGSLIAVAPIPAASGTTFSVTPGEGALFPAVPFNVVVWPAGAAPTLANAEVLRVTSKGTGDNWTATRTQEPQVGSTARSIALGDQISAAITAKTLTDVETAAGTAAAPGGRLTLTTATPVTTPDVTAATTLFYTPYASPVIPLYSGSAWVLRVFAELSIAVPATTSQMYDVFVYDNAGTAALELLAWTNDTTRATALVRQDGRWVKSGATTRLYVGSFRTTTVSGQTEDSAAKRYVWNNYNRVERVLRVLEATATWAYAVNTWRQARATATNQLDVVVGVAESPISVTAMSGAFATGATSLWPGVAIGEDSTTTPSASGLTGATFVNATAAGTDTFEVNVIASLTTVPAAGRHIYVWLENTLSGNSATFWGASATRGQTGIHGRMLG